MRYCSQCKLSKHLLLCVISQDNDESYLFSTALLLVGQSIVTGTMVIIVKHLFTASEETARQRYIPFIENKKIR